MKKTLDAIWAEEAGVMVYIYEGDNGSRIIEIHGIGEDSRETVLATATIAGFRCNRFAKQITTPDDELPERYPPHFSFDPEDIKLLKGDEE